MTEVVTPSPTHVWERGWRFLLAVAAVAVVAHVPALSDRPYNSDEAYLATQAQVIDRGGALYVDTTDRKGPVVPYLYAATFELTGSDGLVAVRLLAIAAVVLAAWLLALEARRRWSDRAGLGAALLFAAGSGAFHAKDFQTLNFEIVMVPAMVGAVMLGARRRYVLAGLALGLATLSKQTALATLLPLVWMAWRDQRGARGRVGALSGLAVGTVAPLACCALVLFDTREFVRWVFLASDGYLAVGDALGFVVEEGLVETATFVAANAAIVLLAVWSWRRERRAGSSQVDLWLWVLAGAFAVASGLRFFGHYYLQLLPPLCLLAARGLEAIPRRVVALVAASVAASLAFFAVPELVGPESDTLATARRLAAYARTHTDPDEAILVWGHLPEVYWWSDRAPATRFVTTGFLEGQSGGRPPEQVGVRYGVSGAWRDFEEDLERHPPALIFELSPADVRNARYTPPSRFARFGRYLERDYEKVATVAGVEVYARRDASDR